MTVSPRQLSHELREQVSPDLARRRWIVGLSLVGIAMGQIVSAYQTGLIKHLPDPPVGPFDSDRVDASNYAYKRLQTPDGLLMLISYGVTAALAGAGGANRAQRLPLVSLAMASKILYDTFLTFKLAGEEWQENQALCAYCQVATLASLASLGLALPEARDAIERLRGRGPGVLEDFRRQVEV
jgi:hypothetical protein